MKKLLGLLLFSTVVLAQSVPNGTIVQGQIWTPTQWNSAWQSKADTASPALTGTPLINGVPIPTYPQTAAEIAAGVTPVNLTFPVGNALRFGCDPTGVTSSQACIANIATYLNSVSGGTEYFPSGVYVTAGNSFTRAQILVRGDGPSSTFFLNSSTNSPALTFGDGVTARFGGGIEGVGFSGKAGVTGVAGQAGFSFLKVGQFHIDNVNVNNVAPGGAALFQGAIFSSASQFFVRNLQVQASINDGITNLNGVDAYITDSRSDSNGGAGWHLDGSQGGYYKSDTGFNNVASAWSLVSTSPLSNPNQNNLFFGAIGDTSGTYNWTITDSKNSYFVNVWGATQQSITVNTFAAGVILQSSNVNGVYFTGGAFINNNNNGVVINDTGGSAPTNIGFVNVQFGSNANGSNGNGRAAGGGSGLSWNGASNHIRVTGGGFEGNSTSAINTSGATGTDNCVTNAVGTQNVGCGIPLSGTSGSIGGGALIAGQCASGTATVTGATTSMVALADPNTYPGDGTIWDAQVTSANTVTVKVCAIIALTPTSSTYNVRVLQ